MAKDFISYELASKLHLNLLALIVIPAIVYHGGFATRMALMRWGVWRGFYKFLWAVFFLTFLIGFIYLDRFYQPSYQAPTSVGVTSQSSGSTSASSSLGQTALGSTADTSNSSGSTSQIVFTASTLSKYNGRNGQPAYVAVDGAVYDLSSVFRNGTHVGFSAGMDQSAAFHQHHNSSILNGFTVVGVYQP